MQKHNQLSKEAISSTEDGNVEMICNSQEYIEPSAILRIGTKGLSNLVKNCPAVVKYRC